MGAISVMLYSSNFYVPSTISIFMTYKQCKTSRKQDGQRFHRHSRCLEQNYRLRRISAKRDPMKCSKNAPDCMKTGRADGNLYYDDVDYKRFIVLPSNQVKGRWRWGYLELSLCISGCVNYLSNARPLKLYVKYKIIVIPMSVVVCRWDFKIKWIFFLSTIFP